MNSNNSQSAKNRRETIADELEASELKFRRLFEAAQDGILLLDANNGEITEVNPFLERILGCSRIEIIGRKLWELGPLKDVLASKEAFLELQEKKYIRYENLPLVNERGESINVEFVSNVYQVKDEKVIQCNIRDITDRARAEAEVKYVSIHDTLTNLYNRAFFEGELQRLQHSRQYPISIFMVDVDGLKAVNDSQGHAAGDELLRRTAKVLIDSLRGEDIIARIGGDEFAVLLSKTNSQSAKNAVERIESRLIEYNERHRDIPLRLSIGLATGKKQNSLLQVLKDADDRMYLQKMRNKPHITQV